LIEVFKEYEKALTEEKAELRNYEFEYEGNDKRGNLIPIFKGKKAKMK